MVSWGHPSHGGTLSASVRAALRGVTALQATDGAFAARTAGAVVTWGAATHGGDSDQVAEQLWKVTRDVVEKWRDVFWSFWIEKCQMMFVC